jgi:hypothetical protein
MIGRPGSSARQTAAGQQILGTQIVRICAVIALPEPRPLPAQNGGYTRGSRL